MKPIKIKSENKFVSYFRVVCRSSSLNLTVRVSITHSLFAVCCDSHIVHRRTHFWNFKCLSLFFPLITPSSSFFSQVIPNKSSNMLGDLELLMELTRVLSEFSK